MGKPTGFMEYQRVDDPERPVDVRIRDFAEFHLELREEQRRAQGGRCMDCGVPFCQSATGCPLWNLIPEWNDLVYRGRWGEALDRLLLTNNFPEFTGLVCPAPCEAACVLSLTSPAVTIKANEYTIIEKAFREGWMRPNPPARRTGRRVAVVGSGPAGLAAADQLNRAGHEVTVYEKDDRFGGLLMYGIPNMKLDKATVRRRIRLMEEEGVVFVASAHVGIDVDARELQAGSDAVLLACGARLPRDLPVPGRALEGIHFAVDYLKESTRRLLDGLPPASGPLSAAGKNVVVIGGGDTGNDCVGTAIRQGCRSVVNFEILPEPPESRLPGNPWPEWPQILRRDYGHREAAAAFARDPRVYSVLTREFAGESRVREVRTVRVSWTQGENGRPVMQERPGTEESRPADLVLLALGFIGPEREAPEALELEADERSNVRALSGDFRTSRPGVFAAGDVRSGQSLVVRAINEGRGAAREIDRYLMGDTQLP